MLRIIVFISVCKIKYSTKGCRGIIAPNSLGDARQDICKDKKCNLGTVAGY